MGERDTEEGETDGEKKETKSEREGNIEGRRQMPRGRSERGRMMEINGEWQLRGLNSRQSESVRSREVTAARCHWSKLLHHCKQKEQRRRRERLSSHRLWSLNI